MRNAFVKALEEEAEKNKDIVLLIGDVGFSVFENFEKRFPDRFFNIGISEQHMMSLAAGLSKAGKKVFVYSIIPFVTLRCIEQIRNDVCYHNLDVVIVGVGTGLSYGYAGFSHHAIEDVAALKSLPNLSIFSPCDALEVKQMVKECMTYNHPIYMRLGKNSPKNFNEEKILDESINLTDTHYLRYGKDVAIISHGDIAEETLCAHEKLKEKEIDVSVISMPLIKPLNTKILDEILKKHKYIIIVEEHHSIGGLGESIFNHNKNNPYNNTFVHLAIDDKFIIEAGDTKYFRKKFDINDESIVTHVLDLINSKI